MHAHVLEGLDPVLSVHQLRVTQQRPQHTNLAICGGVMDGGSALRLVNQEGLRTVVQQELYTRNMPAGQVLGRTRSEQMIWESMAGIQGPFDGRSEEPGFLGSPHDPSQAEGSDTHHPHVHASPEVLYLSDPTIQQQINKVQAMRDISHVAVMLLIVNASIEGLCGQMPPLLLPAPSMTYS